LLERLGGEDAEPDRDAVRQRHVSEAARRFAGDVFEVRGLAPDHAAQRDDGVVAAARGRRFGGHRQLERPGHPHDVHLRVGEPMTAQRVARAFEQQVGDGVIEAADDDRHAAPGGGRGHRQWVRKWPSLSRFTSR
jgi:hypothetical protein